MNKDIIQKTWGSEEIIVNHNYCGKRMTLEKYGCCSMHKHEIKDETFYVDFGEMLLEVKYQDESKFYLLRSGQSFHISPGTFHRFYGVRMTIFYEFSTHDNPLDSIRVTKSQSGMPEDMIVNLIEYSFKEGDNA